MKRNIGNADYLNECIANSMNSMAG